jgi:hypothetical protein
MLRRIQPQTSLFFIALLHFMSISTPSWGKVSFFPAPLLWAFTVLYSELSAFAWMGALGKTVICYLRFLAI